MKYIIIRLSLYFIFFIFPVIAWNSCTFPGGGTYSAAECIVDIQIVYGLANLFAGFMMLNVFTGYIPLLVYALVLPITFEIMIGICKKFWK